jgi:Xaa-Pro aminopeptidase
MVSATERLEPRHATEQARATALLDAERKAEELFAEVVDRGLVIPGKGERQLSDEIRDLSDELLGVRRFWHKRIVRSGVNTTQPYAANPPELRLEEDDIVFFDFGPLFDQWEADFGRSYVLGGDPLKHRLVEDLSRIWQLGHEYFSSRPDVTGSQLYGHVLELIRASGWGHGASHVGHLVGEFPHEVINGDDIDCYITHGNDDAMRRPDRAGHDCHWILEVHLIEPDGRFGGFFEQLLDLRPDGGAGGS